MSKEQGTPKTATALATAVGFDVNALRKSNQTQNCKGNANGMGTGPVLRHVSAMGYIVETGPDEYKPNNFSLALTLPIIGDPYLL